MAVSRRRLIAAAGMIAAGGTVPAVARAVPRARVRKPATFVLVHGGGHGGWCWKRVAEPLRAAGHRVFAPTLTGVGDRIHLLSPAVDLDLHITDILNLMQWDDLDDVILVGHSYGGMVITGVADRAIERIRHMVYLDAAHPRNGAALWGARSVTGGNGGAARGSAMMNGTEMISLPSEQLVRGALGVTKPDEFAWVMAKLTAHPLKCFTQPLVLKNEAAVHKLPTTDIWRSSILANHRKTGVEKQTWAQNLWEIDSPSHNLMITEAKKTTDMLLKIAAM